ncbi:hypothetical protein MMJ09_23570, partial [Bacillus vallismortis]|nr:hypothetical protein [Bacillus vallismortis]
KNPQYAKYAIRTMGNKLYYAVTEKINYVHFPRVYKELEKPQEKQTAAERKVKEMKRKLTMYKMLREQGMGTYINRDL